MRNLAVYVLLAIAALVLVAGPALAQDSGQTAAGTAAAADTQAAQGTTLPEKTQTADVTKKVGGIGDKLTDLAAALVPIGLIAAAVALMFSAKTGQKLLIYVVAGAALALGGWKLIVDIIKYIFGAW